MQLKRYRHVYLIGAGGISVSAIAKLFLARGVRVSGFDLAESVITDELLRMGARVVIKDERAGLPEGIDLVVYSEAVPNDDPRRVRARLAGIPEMAAAAFWGEFSRSLKVIAVSGTNGKSTTTA
ncbi:MAG: UDP-N-acetylmuramate--L-alanine ligase, partial [Parcubacteria group bacterium]|nr:UDP-N-acetylmuramate--L-alanine ligase [Parcubacteria group bacterium]